MEEFKESKGENLTEAKVEETEGNEGKLINIVEGEESKNEDEVYLDPSKNPLLMDLNLHRLFKLLSCEQLKECRCVCRKWLELSQSYFEERSMWAFNDLNPEWGTAEEKLILTTQFFWEYRSECYITAVHFRGEMEKEVLKAFFDSKSGEKIKDLRFCNILIVERFKRQKVFSKRYNIDELIRPNNLTNIKITVEEGATDYNEYKKTTIILLSSSSIKFCPRVHLERTSLICDEKISPVYFNIEKGYLISEENCEDKEKVVLVNNCIDLSQVKQLFLPAFQFYGLDLRDLTICIPEFSFWEYKPNPNINWEFGKWRVEKLTSNDPQNVAKSNLDVELLVLSDWKEGINVSALPKCIKGLIIGPHLNVFKYYHQESSTPTVYCSHAMPKFKKLEYLKIEQYVESVCYFTRCLVLQDIVLEGSLKDIRKISVKVIPKSVRKLSLSYVELIPCEYGYKLELDTLVLRNYPCNNICVFFKMLRPVNLVLNHSMELWNYFESDDTANIGERLTLDQWNDFLSYTLNKRIRKVVIGPLENTLLPPSTLKFKNDANYCLFKYYSPEFITFEEFKEFADFQIY